MNVAESGSGEGTPLRVASGRLVFHSGLVSLDDPRITPLRESYDELVEQLLRPSAEAFGNNLQGRLPK
jgi:hypothetical protein